MATHGASSTTNETNPLAATQVQTALSELMDLMSVQIRNFHALAAAAGHADLPVPATQRVELLAALAELDGRCRRCIEQTRHCQIVLERAMPEQPNGTATEGVDPPGPRWPVPDQLR